MSAPKALILRAAGTNCEEETAHAFSLAGAEPASLHIRELLESPQRLSAFRILTIPGGFTYGDDLSAGKILANQLTLRLQDALAGFLDAGGLVLGICNGFQALVKMGILPGGTRPWKVEATLAENDSGRFESRWVRLECPADSVCVFTRGMRALELPVAHGEGKLVFASLAVLERIRRGRQVALRYASAAPGREPAYPEDPNGSADHIAGLCDPTGRVLGLMPHPERFVDARHHPDWRARGLSGRGEGLQIFRNAVDTVR